MSTKKKNKNWTTTLALINIIITIGLAFFVYIQNERINSLSKGQLANDILISSPNMDTINPSDTPINLTLDVFSNYDGAMPIRVKLVEVRQNGQKVVSEYKHTAINDGNKEQIIKKDDTAVFEYSFESLDVGEYQLDYVVYYNYDQKEQDLQRGKSKTFTLKLVITK